jgi:6-phospho-beta-glucosidase
MKVAVIGGGSTYTPELINSFLDKGDRIAVSEIWLMDIDKARLEIVGGFVKRLVEKTKSKLQIILSDDLRKSISGANIVITQFRVGQMQARNADEYLAKRHGLVGQDTIGVGGMATALRTIPVILEICDVIRQHAPKALLLNFTHPTGLIMEAIQRYAPKINALGVCNSAYTTKMKILKYLSDLHGSHYDPEDGELLTLGLNHLTWHFGFKLNGQDVWDEVFAGYLKQLRAMQEPTFHPDSIERQRMIPNEYLEFYFQKKIKIALQDAWPPSWAEQVMEVEEKLLALYADLAISTIPDDLMQRGGTNYARVATSIIDSYWNDLGETHIVNVSHNGMVKGWEKEWVLEMPCRVDKHGMSPLPMQPLPLYNYALLEQVKQYQLMTVEAAVHGDREAAFQALVTHPLGPTEDNAATVLEDMLQTHQRFLPRFFL